jgi:hypothetical protein
VRDDQAASCGDPKYRLLGYANEWAMRELPEDAERWWSREKIVDEVVRVGFEGMQTPVDWTKVVRSAGLRFCVAGRANTPAELHAVAANTVQMGHCLTFLITVWTCSRLGGLSNGMNPLGGKMATLLFYGELVNFNGGENPLRAQLFERTYGRSPSRP